jgi:hypothetical protein
MTTGLNVSGLMIDGPVATNAPRPESDRTAEYWVSDHEDLVGVSEGQFHVGGAKISEDTLCGKLETVSVPTNLSHVTDGTVSKVRKEAIPSLDEPT